MKRAMKKSSPKAMKTAPKAKKSPAKFGTPGSVKRNTTGDIARSNAVSSSSAGAVGVAGKRPSTDGSGPLQTRNEKSPKKKERLRITKPRNAFVFFCKIKKDGIMAEMKKDNNGREPTIEEVSKVLNWRFERLLTAEQKASYLKKKNSKFMSWFVSCDCDRPRYFSAMF